MILTLSANPESLANFLIPQHPTELIGKSPQNHPARLNCAELRILQKIIQQRYALFIDHSAMQPALRRLRSLSSPYLKDNYVVHPQCALTETASNILASAQKEQQQYNRDLRQILTSETKDYSFLTGVTDDLSCACVF
jgi:hypothetical protein